LVKPITVFSIFFIALSASGSKASDVVVKSTAMVTGASSRSLPRTEASPEAQQAVRLAGRALYLSTIVREAESRGLPPAVADAVTSVESGYDPNRVGGVGEVGLMQVRPQTAAMLGYKGSVADLFEPDVNIRYGVAYLAEAWNLAKGDLCRALMKYRAGHGEEHMTPRSVDYCFRARAHLAVVGLPQARPSLATGAGSTPTTTHTYLPDAAEQARRTAIAGIRRRAWADYVARIRAIERSPAVSRRAS